VGVDRQNVCVVSDRLLFTHRHAAPHPRIFIGFASARQMLYRASDKLEGNDVDKVRPAKSKCPTKLKMTLIDEPQRGLSVRSGVKAGCVQTVAAGDAAVPCGMIQKLSGGNASADSVGS
jgi:hypothetical protein